MDGKELALAAYRNTIEEIARRQQNIVMREALVARFGKQALPVQEFYRRIEPRHQTMAQAEALVAREQQADENTLKKLYVQVSELEQMFEAYHERSDAEWAQGVADYIRSSR